MFTSKVVATLIAGIISAAMAVAFLGFLAIKIGAVPFAVIVFAVLSMMLWDFFDTMRETVRTAGKINGENRNGNDA